MNKEKLISLVNDFLKAEGIRAQALKYHIHNSHYDITVFGINCSPIAISVSSFKSNRIESQPVDINNAKSQYLNDLIKYNQKDEQLKKVSDKFIDYIEHNIREQYELLSGIDPL